MFRCFHNQYGYEMEAMAGSLAELSQSQFLQPDQKRQVLDLLGRFGLENTVPDEFLCNPYFEHFEIKGKELVHEAQQWARKLSKDETTR